MLAGETEVSRLVLIEFEEVHVESSILRLKVSKKNSERLQDTIEKRVHAIAPVQIAAGIVSILSTGQLSTSNLSNLIQAITATLRQQETMPAPKDLRTESFKANSVE